MKIAAARAISIAAHPFVLVLLLIFLPLAQRDAGGAFRTALVFTAIVILPVALLIRRSYISGAWRTVDASDKTDRPILFRTAVGGLAVAVVYFHFVASLPDMVRGCLVAVGMLLIAAGLNRWIKLSLHVTCACFCGVLLTRIRLGLGLPVLLMLPPLMWSRLVLSRHVISEVCAGALLGLAGAAGFIWL